MDLTLRAAALIFAVMGLSFANAATAPLRLTPEGHYVTPVSVNGQSFEFVIDTGAQKSVVSPAVAERLGLASAGDAHIHGASGASAARLVTLQSYSSAIFSQDGAQVVVLPNGGAVKDGVVGMDLFAQQRLEFDFKNGAVRTAASGPIPANFLAVPAALTRGTFMVADVRVNGVAVKALIDTGGRRTVGNEKLRQALGLREGDARLSPTTPIGGATADTTAAMKAPVDLLTLGPHHFDRPVITFADMPVMKALGLDDGPAIILGLDLLQQAGAIAIDYPRGELQIRR